MANLIIVESPTKIKSIKTYLGSDYDVVASKGHIRDLPKSKLGVDIENNFEPMYENMKDKAEVIKELKKHAKECDKVYLAADPDREGEAISWHLAHILGLDINEPTRITFNEITKTGVLQGIENPRSIDMNLVNSQQARRVLDRLVGYKLSPFLWKKVQKGLSAGRVQSVAVRLIVDREEEIRNFKSEEYWSVEASLKTENNKTAFIAKLHSKNGKKIKLSNKEQTDAILSDLNGAKYTVASVKKSDKKRNPSPPFITSTLQQEASKRFGFQGTRTMKVAQELYEGIAVGQMGQIGLITYMRTDSLRISNEAQTAAEKYILENYGKEYLPASARRYKTKANVQDAHEAIRPTSVELTPQSVKSSLTTDQYKLYKLIWERFVASRMESAVFNTVSADIKAGDYLFKASGSTLKFKGYTAVYEDSKEDGEEDAKRLPAFKEGDALTLVSINGNQHFTQPPSRYTDYMLVKALEENGVGRPSTYAPIISTIIARNYVEREEKKLKPTILGEVTTNLMKEYFKDIVDVDFTANMEKQLDEVNDGKIEWHELIREFYDGFAETLTEAEEKMQGKRVKIPAEETDVECELCGRKMVIKTGRFGKFLACPGFPECKNTKKIVQETKGTCPVCGGKMQEKKSKKGRKFFGCGNYPDCTFMTWDTPIDEKCPQCGASLFKKGVRSSKVVCLKEDCGYEGTLAKKSESDED